MFSIWLKKLSFIHHFMIKPKEDDGMHFKGSAQLFHSSAKV